MKNYQEMKVEEGDLNMVRLSLDGPDCLVLDLDRTVTVTFGDNAHKVLEHLKHIVRVAEAVLYDEEPAAEVNSHG